MKGIFRARLYGPDGELLDDSGEQQNRIFSVVPQFYASRVYNAPSGSRTAVGVRPGIPRAFSQEGQFGQLMHCIFLSTRQDPTDDPDETQVGYIEYNSPNNNDLGNSVLPLSGRTFASADRTQVSNPPGTISFRFIYGPQVANGTFTSAEIWGRIDPVRDGLRRECFKAARVRFVDGLGNPDPRTKTAAATLVLDYSVTVQALP